MQTMRRFLVLTPVALGVTALIALVYVLVGAATAGDEEPLQVGETLLYTLPFALAAVVAVLAAVLAVVGLLSLLGVRNAWAALGLAFALVAVGCALRYVADRPWVSDDEDWDLLFLIVAMVASIPTWLTFAAGLLVGDRRNRAARDRTVGATT
jgi:ABC-type Fe3+-siderophore transport system permease subunit